MRVFKGPPPVDPTYCLAIGIRDGVYDWINGKPCAPKAQYRLGDEGRQIYDQAYFEGRRAATKADQATVDAYAAAGEPIEDAEKALDAQIRLDLHLAAFDAQFAEVAEAA